MMSKMMCEQLEKKLKLERTEICLNCRRFVKCEDIGKYEECVNFDEIVGAAWVIRKI